MGLDWRMYPHFTEAEMMCKCGCGKADMDPAFMKWLEAVRRRYGDAMLVSSGYRCPDHNDKVSKTGRDGPHTTGRAVDIQVAGPAAYDLVGAALDQYVTGIGVSQKGKWLSRFIHLDILKPPEDDAPRPRIWSY